MVIRGELHSGWGRVNMLPYEKAFRRFGHHNPEQDAVTVREASPEVIAFANLPASERNRRGLSVASGGTAEYDLSNAANDYTAAYVRQMATEDEEADWLRQRAISFPEEQ